MNAQNLQPAIMIAASSNECHLITDGKQSILLSKSFPKKVKTPFKCYIYESKGRPRLIRVKKTEIGQSGLYPFKKWYYSEFIKGCCPGTGKVIGEFVCERADSYIRRENSRYFWDLSVAGWEGLKEGTCLTIEQIINYADNSNECYGLHISNLKIYDTPKELSEFRRYYECGNSSCGTCDKCSKDYHLKQSPHPWCYVNIQYK